MGNSILLDADGQPVNKAFGWKRRFDRSVESLLGIVRGLVADNELGEGEIAFLATWLNDHPEVLLQWPGSVIADRVRGVMEDGVITASEAKDLCATLSELIGGSVAESGATTGLATRLPVDQCSSLVFVDHSYCFTGKFILGPRSECEAVVLDRGANVSGSVTTRLNYLVIGGLASRDWIHTSYGRKIEKAVEYKRKGRPITILAEERWAELIGR